jgi:hypothetical protein
LYHAGHTCSALRQHCMCNECNNGWGQLNMVMLIAASQGYSSTSAD